MFNRRWYNDGDDDDGGGDEDGDGDESSATLLTNGHLIYMIISTSL